MLSNVIIRFHTVYLIIISSPPDAYIVLNCDTENRIRTHFA